MWTELEQSEILWDAQPAVLLTMRDIHESKLRAMRLEQERRCLQEENLHCKSTLLERYKFGELIGKSSAMQHVYEFIEGKLREDFFYRICTIEITVPPLRERKEALSLLNRTFSRSISPQAESRPAQISSILTKTYKYMHKTLCGVPWKPANHRLC